LRERVVVEHRIARLVGLGICKSRYVGKKKTRWQVVMAAVVANVSLVVGYCRRRAHNLDAATAAQSSAQPTNPFLAAVSPFGPDLFGWKRTPVWAPCWAQCNGSEAHNKPPSSRLYRNTSFRMDL
jgi:hypothetical protein